MSPQYIHRLESPSIQGKKGFWHIRRTVFLSRSRTKTQPPKTSGCCFFLSVYVLDCKASRASLGYKCRAQFQNQNLKLRKNLRHASFDSRRILRGACMGQKHQVIFPEFFLLKMADNTVHRCRHRPFNTELIQLPAVLRQLYHRL